MHSYEISCESIINFMIYEYLSVVLFVTKSEETPQRQSGAVQEPAQRTLEHTDERCARPLNMHQFLFGEQQIKKKLEFPLNFTVQKV
jgi:hypothetical protein